MVSTWAAEPVGNQRGAFINIHRLVLFGQGLWSQEPIVPGHTEQRVLLRWAMDICCPHLYKIRTCSEKNRSASFAIKSRAIALPAFSGIWHFRKVSAVARLPAWTRRARLTSTSQKARQPLLFRDRYDNHILGRTRDTKLSPRSETSWKCLSGNVEFGCWVKRGHFLNTAATLARLR